LGVIRVDDMSGNPIATLWNFQVHPVCWGPDNMLFSSDLVGGVTQALEQQLSGAVVLFMQGDAGDIDPAPGMCNGQPKYYGIPLFLAGINNVRNAITMSTWMSIGVASQIVPFGPTNMNLTLGRLNNCTLGGPLDICSICTFLDCDANLHLPESWLEESPRFTAFRFTINTTDTAIVTMPGEPLVELGWWVRNDTIAMGFDLTFLSGYSNNHMGYFATPDQYNAGGYESLLSFWGEDTAVMVRSGVKTVAIQVAPK